MKRFLLMGVSLLVLLGACKRSDEDKKISIAILTPVTHPSLEQIEKGFRETMEGSYPGLFRFTTYNAQGNKTLMRSEIEEVARQNYALVFTLATSPSQMTREVFEKKGIEIPIVFTCVNDPVGFHIVSSEETRAEHVTGVKEMVRFEEEMAALLAYKPTVQTVLLVYDPSNPGLSKDQQQIEQILKKQGIALQNVEIYKANELLSKVEPFMAKADAVIVLKDNTVVSGLDALVKLCDRYRVPLMASDLDSPDRGAAFGYGVHEIEFGIEGAKKAIQILVNGEQPGNIPVTPIENFTLRVNSDAAIRQGITLP